jgi:hypothetical protein
MTCLVHANTLAHDSHKNSSYRRYDYHLQNDVSQLRLEVRILHLMISEQLVNLVGPTTGSRSNGLNLGLPFIFFFF